MRADRVDPVIRARGILKRAERGERVSRKRVKKARDYWTLGEARKKRRGDSV